MRAVVQDRYGDPAEVLRVEDVPRPSPAAGEVLVRVHAAPVAGDDWHILRGQPYAARPAIGLRRPRSRVAGLELAGRVEAVGAGVAAFGEGDDVFGWCRGSFAEYVSVPAGQLARKPANVTMTQAAAVPISAFTALQGLRDHGRLRAGQHVLVNGASGGVGTFAVQIAKSYGAEVTAVCSGAKADLVRDLGADHVIDYGRESLAAGGRRFDLILDIQGNPSLSTCRQALRPRGTLVIVGGSGGKWFMGTSRWIRAMALSPFVTERLRVCVHRDRPADLAFIAELIEAGRIVPRVDRTFPLTDVAKAMRYVQDGHARGKVVIDLLAG